MSAGRVARAQAGWLVVWFREMTVKLSEKTFRIGFISTLVLLVVGLAGLSFFASRADDFTVGTVGASGDRIVELAQLALQAGDPESEDAISAESFEDSEAATDEVRAGSVNAAVIPVSEDGGTTWRIVADSGVDTQLVQSLASAVQQSGLAENADEAGVPLQQLTNGTVAEIDLLDSDPQGDAIALVLKLLFGFMFVSALMTFGLAIAQSIVEEKESRVVEILAAAVPVRHLLFGKIAANFTLGLLQVSVLITVALVGLRVIDVIPDLAPVVAASGWFIAFFILNFIAVACVWSALGSMATKGEDLASSAVPMQLVLFGAYFVGFLGADSLLVIASFVPVFSSIAMPSRILDGGVMWWEPILSGGLVIAFGVVTIFLSSRIYRRTLMRTNKRTTFREALAPASAANVP